MKNVDLHRYNLAHDLCLREIREILERNSAFYKSVLMRCVIVRDTSANELIWHNALGKIAVSVDISESEKHESTYFEDISMIKYWFAPSSLLDLIEQMKAGHLKLGIEDINLSSNEGFREILYMHHHNSNSSLPGYLYRTYSTSTKLPIPLHPILAHDKPFYVNGYDAIIQWLQMNDFHGERDSRIGTISLFLPECRAYFDTLFYEEKKKELIITVKKNVADLNLFLKGAYFSPYGFKTIDLRVESEYVNLSLSHEEALNLDELKLFLIDDNDNIFDYHEEGRYLKKDVPSAFKLLRKETQDNIIKQAIAIGENDTIEFKPFIGRDSKKIEEIIESVIAFANTKGGNIFIGISKYATPEGVEKDIAKIAAKQSKKIDTALQEYMGFLRMKISDGLNKVPQYRIGHTEIMDHRFIMIEVPEGGQKPYAHRLSKNIFVRHGASNVKPDPDTELPKLFGYEKV